MNKKMVLGTAGMLVVILVCAIFLMGTIGDRDNTSESVSVAEPTEVSSEETSTAEVTTEVVTTEAVKDEGYAGFTKNYLILIESETQRESVEAFKAFKESKGFNVVVKSVEQDLVYPEGVNRSDVLEDYLSKLDESLSLDYVLLVGEPYDQNLANPQNTGGIIPMRYMYFDDDNHNTKYNYDWYDYDNPYDNAYNTPSDFTYAIKLSWDYDKDGYAGERRELNRTFNKEKSELRFLLGRIPFSDSESIAFILNNTINYESNQKEKSSALIATGMIGYPENIEFNKAADGGYYGDELATNLEALQIDSTTMFEKLGVMPSEFDATFPLSKDKFIDEFKKGYDMTYTFGHGGSVMMFWDEDVNGNKVCDEEIPSYDLFDANLKGLSTGFLYFDGCHTMVIEKDTDNQNVRHFQDLMLEGVASAGVATTRQSSFSPMEYTDRVISNVFSNGSNNYAYEFYQSMNTLITNDHNYEEAYVYCFIGDPSLEIFP